MAQRKGKKANPEEPTFKDNDTKGKGITQTVRLQVEFPGLRATDRLAVYQRLWKLQADLTRAATRLSSALFALDAGHLPQPMDTLDRPVLHQTLVYQGMSGDWEPLRGRPAYQPSEPHVKASGKVLLAVAEHVRIRCKTDRNDVWKGKKALATFNTLPIMYNDRGVKLTDRGTIELLTFSRETGNTHIVVRPYKLDPSRRAILARCLSGEYKPGSATLSWDKKEGRAGKWFLCLSWTNKHHTLLEPQFNLPAEQPDTQIVAGVDIGISRHSAWIAFVDMKGEPLKKPEVIPARRDVVRAIGATVAERRQRSGFNRAPLGLREGKGRTRKLRVTAKIGDRISCLKESALQEAAAATVAACKKRGVSLIAIEDHGDWGGRQSARRLAVDFSTDAKEYSRVFQTLQARMRELLLWTAKREGIRAVAVNPAYTSRICHKCGLNWKAQGVYTPKGAPETDKALGRVKWDHFVCSCGYEGHPDHNAAINIARRGLEELKGHVEDQERKATEKAAAIAAAGPQPEAPPKAPRIRAPRRKKVVSPPPVMAGSPSAK